MKFYLVSVYLPSKCVALFTRAWIEILTILNVLILITVALFTRAWIEIANATFTEAGALRRPLYEGVD